MMRTHCEQNPLTRENLRVAMQPVHGESPFGSAPPLPGRCGELATAGRGEAEPVADLP